MGLTPLEGLVMGTRSAIINAIENHDGELAEMLMKRHISASQANIQTKFDGYQSVQATQNEMAN